MKETRKRVPSKESIHILRFLSRLFPRMTQNSHNIWYQILKRLIQETLKRIPPKKSIYVLRSLSHVSQRMTQYDNDLHKDLSKRPSTVSVPRFSQNDTEKDDASSVGSGLYEYIHICGYEYVYIHTPIHSQRTLKYICVYALEYILIYKHEYTYIYTHIITKEH